jgi:hypothetical protein
MKEPGKLITIFSSCKYNRDRGIAVHPPQDNSLLEKEIPQSPFVSL